eukprot:GHRQ01032239.1.p1 GENE.GHRQ01032239.1~~GHRQ01032239.1.p1  ORF type:complete len:214 (-),score=33.93 GHRQ01032239.1:161-760(-)
MGGLCDALLLSLPQSRYLNSVTYLNRRSNDRWVSSDTELFYKALAIFGTDFTAIAKLFPGRDRWGAAAAAAAVAVGELPETLQAFGSETCTLCCFFGWSTVWSYANLSSWNCSALPHLLQVICLLLISDRARPHALPTHSQTVPPTKDCGPQVSAPHLQHLSCQCMAHLLPPAFRHGTRIAQLLAFRHAWKKHNVQLLA